VIKGVASPSTRILIDGIDAGVAGTKHFVFTIAITNCRWWFAYASSRPRLSSLSLVQTVIDSFVFFFTLLPMQNRMVSFLFEFLLTLHHLTAV
jgi:hypothetical protein